MDGHLYQHKGLLLKNLDRNVLGPLIFELIIQEHSQQSCDSFHSRNLKSLHSAFYNVNQNARLRECTDRRKMLKGSYTNNLKR